MTAETVEAGAVEAAPESSAGPGRGAAWLVAIAAVALATLGWALAAPGERPQPLTADGAPPGVAATQQAPVTEAAPSDRASAPAAAPALEGQPAAHETVDDAVLPDEAATPAAPRRPAPKSRTVREVRVRAGTLRSEDF